MTNSHIPIIQFKNEKYDFDLMSEQIHELIIRYPFLRVYELGKSQLGKILFLLELGKGKRRIHINASHHANEWITSYIVMNSLELLCEEIKRGLLDENSFCLDIVPMVNPDGVQLCLDGATKLPTRLREKLFFMNEGSNNFSRWKANINGVDLNRNYDAGFKHYKQISEKQLPSYAYYAGIAPESEPETKALARLTRSRHYDLVLAYHTQGEVIYWTYSNLQVPKAHLYAIMFSSVSGYLLDEPDENAASGGYKDWFIKCYRKPGFTIECGLGENPISISQAPTIMKQTFPIIKAALKDL